MSYKDKEKARAKCREYYEKNKEKLKKHMIEYSKDWYERNKVRLQEYRNRPEIKERNNKMVGKKLRKNYMKEYMNNPKNKLKRNKYNRIYNKQRKEIDKHY